MIHNILIYHIMKILALESKIKIFSANSMIRKQQQIYDSDQHKQVQKENNNQLLKLTDQFTKKETTIIDQKSIKKTTSDHFSFLKLSAV